MKESEAAELFNRELDSLLQGGKEAAFSPDPGAMAFAGGLARFDLSGQSLIKESLRARLAGREGRGLLEALRALFFNNFARAALAAAALLVVLLPLARRPERAPGFLPPVQQASLPQQAGAPSPVPPVSARPSRGADDAGLFAAVPMAAPAAQAISEFPIAAAGSGSPIVLAEGREVKLEKGSAIIFDTGSAVFALERRVVTPEELFERSVI
jgi:hypothetical protein